MIRKLFLVAALATALAAPSQALARGGGHHVGGGRMGGAHMGRAHFAGHFGGGHGHWRQGGGRWTGGSYASYSGWRRDSCWRWSVDLGRRVNVCGGAYYGGGWGRDWRGGRHWGYHHAGGHWGGGHMGAGRHVGGHMGGGHGRR